MRLAVLRCCALALLTSAPVESPVYVGSQRQYTGEHFTFSYPTNWKVDFELTTFISLRGPCEACTLTIEVDDPGTTKSLLEIVRDAIKRRASNEGLTGVSRTLFDKLSKDQSISQDPITETIVKRPQLGIREAYVFRFLVMRLRCRATYFLVRTDTRSFLFMADAAQEDWKKLEPGVKLIYDSFTPAAR